MDETVESSERGPSRAAPVPGGRIGKYELLRQLGTGGMGVVWAARDPDLDREVAIKVLRAADASAEQRTRFLREARAMARLKHPNVLTVYEVNGDGDRDFIAMELVDGANLDAWLRGRPPAREVWDALFAAGRGLAAAHEAGLVHRDFKPHNVLRSRDCRVLVTDFGLARGHNDADPLASTHNADPLASTHQASEPSAGDSVLDVRLTTTGQLLGTPAYMAPEQFVGTAPDPRTDQFAFCVTAWEALSAERPFRGTTLDALRTETGRGVANAAPGAAKLSGAVRGVLVRGMAPDRARRFADMAALLRALARARRARTRRMAIAAPIAAAAIAGVALFTHHGQTAQPAACVPGEQVIASAWSPAVRADLLAKHPDATAAVQAFDDHAKRWLAGYQHACTRPAAQRSTVLECYLGARDELAVQSEIVHRFGAAALAPLESWGVLAGRDVCAGDAPTASLRLPDDARRTRAIALLAKTYGNLESAPSNVLGEQAALRDEAKQLAWPLLAARIEEAVAIDAIRLDQYDVAHKSYRSAADLARSAGDGPEEARARVGVLATGRLDIVDEMPKNAYEDELRDAELAVKAAGDDPAIRAELDGNRAAHAAFGEYDLSRAIELDEHAYSQLRDLHDVRGSLRIAHDLTQFLVLRSAAGDLDRAAAIAAELTAAVEHAPFQGVLTDLRLRNVRAWVAWFKGDLAAAHAALDVPGYPVVPGGKSRTGHVVDETGHPVARALVITWSGDLFGDATRIYSDVRSIAFDTATTDEHGAFTIQAHDSEAIMAELGDRRSVRVVVRDNAELVLRATHSIAGTVDLGGDVATGLEPYARIDVTPTTAWFDSTPPASDGHFTIQGIPPAPTVSLGAQGTSWPRELGRRIAAGAAIDHAVNHWPVGASIDNVVKAASGIAWVLRGKVAPKTRAELERLVRASPDAATVSITPIGWGNATFTGLQIYGVGEHHFAIGDNAPGPVTVCVGADKDAGVRCRPDNVVEESAPLRRDGRRWYGGEGADFDTAR